MAHRLQAQLDLDVAQASRYVAKAKTGIKDAKRQVRQTGGALDQARGNAKSSFSSTAIGQRGTLTGFLGLSNALQSLIDDVKRTDDPNARAITSLTQKIAAAGDVANGPETQRVLAARLKGTAVGTGEAGSMHEAVHGALPPAELPTVLQAVAKGSSGRDQRPGRLDWRAVQEYVAAGVGDITEALGFMLGSSDTEQGAEAFRAMTRKLTETRKPTQAMSSRLEAFYRASPERRKGLYFADHTLREELHGDQFASVEAMLRGRRQAPLHPMDTGWPERARYIEGLGVAAGLEPPSGASLSRHGAAACIRSTVGCAGQIGMGLGIESNNDDPRYATRRMTEAPAAQPLPTSETTLGNPPPYGGTVINNANQVYFNTPTDRAQTPVTRTNQ